MAEESLPQYALSLISAEAQALERRAAELRRQADPRDSETFDALMNKAEGIFEAARGVRAVEALLQAKLAARTPVQEVCSNCGGRGQHIHGCLKDRAPVQEVERG